MEASLEGETARDNGQHGNLRDVHGVFGRFSTEMQDAERGAARDAMPASCPDFLKYADVSAARYSGVCAKIQYYSGDIGPYA